MRPARFGDCPLDRQPGEPTPAQIRRACAGFRASWSGEELFERSHGRDLSGLSADDPRRLPTEVYSLGVADGRAS